MKLHCQDLTPKELESCPAFLSGLHEFWPASHTVLAREGSPLQACLQVPTGHGALSGFSLWDALLL